MNKIRINQGRILPSQFRFLLTLMTVVGIMAMTIYVTNEVGFMLSILFAMLLLLVWTSFYMLEVDVSAKTYQTYNAILGRAFFREEVRFEKIRGVVIKEANYSQTMYSRSGIGHTWRWKEFEAQLLLDEDKKVILISDEDRQALLERLNPILKKLRAEIISS
jgi:hypothetical protein